VDGRSNPVLALLFRMKLKDETIVRSRWRRPLHRLAKLEHLGIDVAWLLRCGRLELTMENVEHLFLFRLVDTQIHVKLN